MDKIIITILLGFALFACSRDYEIKVYNETQHLVFAQINDGDQKVIQGNQSYTFELDSEVNMPFQEERKNVDLSLEGETFVMYQGGAPTFTTSLEVRPDKVYKVFANPTHAGVKLINLSNTIIDIFEYRKNTIFESNTYQLDGNIAPSDSTFARLPYPTVDNPFSIDFLITIDDITYTYEGYELGKDEQARIEFTLEGGK